MSVCPVSGVLRSMRLRRFGQAVCWCRLGSLLLRSSAFWSEVVGIWVWHLVYTVRADSFCILNAVWDWSSLAVQVLNLVSLPGCWGPTLTVALRLCSHSTEVKTQRLMKERFKPETLKNWSSTREERESRKKIKRVKEREHSATQSYKQGNQCWTEKTNS